MLEAQAEGWRRIAKPIPPTASTLARSRCWRSSAGISRWPTSWRPLIRQEEDGEQLDLDAWQALLLAQDRESGRIASLATRLRLSLRPATRCTLRLRGRIPTCPNPWKGKAWQFGSNWRASRQPRIDTAAFSEGRKIRIVHAFQGRQPDANGRRHHNRRDEEQLQRLPEFNYNGGQNLATDQRIELGRYE